MQLGLWGTAAEAQVGTLEGLSFALGAGIALDELGLTLGQLTRLCREVLR